MVEVTAADQTLFDNLLGPVSGYAEWGLPDNRDDALQIIAAHRTATLQQVIDLANACVDQGIPLAAMVPMLEDMR